GSATHGCAPRSPITSRRNGRTWPPRWTGSASTPPGVAIGTRSREPARLTAPARRGVRGSAVTLAQRRHVPPARPPCLPLLPGGVEEHVAVHVQVGDGRGRGPGVAGGTVQ